MDIYIENATSSPTATTKPALSITPGIEISDPYCAYWFTQVNLRLRREICWCWFQRMQQSPIEGVLPPVVDAAAENLDLARFAEQKVQFFSSDATCIFLTEQIDNLAQPQFLDKVQSSHWQQVAERLNLTEAEQFVVALALAIQIDSGLAPIFACCLNDLSRPFPTLALAQRLWDEPGKIIPCADPGHRLFRFGLLKGIKDVGHIWQRHLEMPSCIAHQLIDSTANLVAGLTPLTEKKQRSLNATAQMQAARLSQTEQQQGKMTVVPLLGAKGRAFDDWALALSTSTEKKVVAISRLLIANTQQLSAIACICWLHKTDILLPEGWLEEDNTNEKIEALIQTQEIPVRWYAPLSELGPKTTIPAELTSPGFKIEGLDFNHRVAFFLECLGPQAEDIRPDIEECARRFRFEEKTITRICQVFTQGGVRLTKDNLNAVCASEAVVEIGQLAQAVPPRFGVNELVLPKNQHQQIQDILQAMRSLTVVHYHWGTAKVWNESGLSVLFCGTPGTGKTMAAEAIASELSLPMYRIDLSQVVNKYIGETEKNLKRIFDAAELSDCILFFDEADALFGKRTDVKDAHDRFANIEVSYLLERMERFKGLAILATNRRKDLDEAFLRRLRYVVEFPVPGFQERLRIWQQVFPCNVDTSSLDIRYLAKQFQLSGGHIRSVAFNACLRAASADNAAEARVDMPDVLMAIKRELEKINRSASEELFGNYSHLLELPQ